MLETLNKLLTGEGGTYEDDGNISGVTRIDIAQGVFALPQIQDFLRGLSNQKFDSEFDHVRFSDFVDVIVPPAISGSNCILSGLNETKIHVCYSDIIAMFSRNPGTIEAGSFKKAAAFTPDTVGGDVVPSTSGTYHAIAIAAADALRDVLIGYRLQISAVDAQSTSTSVDIYSSGVSNPFQVQLKDSNKVAELFLFASSPRYKNSVDVDVDGATWSLDTPSNAEHFRIGYNANVVDPTVFDVAAIPDIVVGFTAVNASINVFPVTVNASNLATFAILFANGGL